MKIFRNLAVLSALVSAVSLTISFTSCKKSDSHTSRVKFTVADRNAKNFALVVGSPNDLVGVYADVKNVSAIFKTHDLGYQQEVIEHATRDQVLRKASEISAKLSPESTVFFYYSGHGAETGELSTEGWGSVTLREVANSFGSKLSGGRFKRFIAVIDSCYSGQNAVGSSAIFLNKRENSFSLDSFLAGLSTGSGTGLFGGADGAGTMRGGSIPFEQGLVLAASRPSEESGDGDSSTGGTFTSSLMEAIRSGRSSTLQQILDNAKKITVAKSFGTQTPVWKAMPETMLQERFDRRDNVSSPGSTGQNPVTNQEQPSNQPAATQPVSSNPNQTVITVGDQPAQGTPAIISQPTPSGVSSVGANPALSSGSANPSLGSSNGSSGNNSNSFFQSILNAIMEDE